MIEIKNLNKNFSQKKVLSDINLFIKKQEIFGLVGADGAGKTTLLRIILDLLKPESGFVKFAKNNLENSIKEKIAYVPQTFSLYNNLTVLENINLIASCYGLKQKNIQNQTKEILEFTSLYEYKDRFAEKLSGGMKQKLALASALIHNPEIIFLDEPTTGVDPVSRREFWQLLHYINRQGTTIIVSTPYMDEAEFCHRIAFIDNGKIIECDTPDNLVKNYPNQLLALQIIGVFPNLSTINNIIDISIFGQDYHIAVSNNSDSTIEEIHLACKENNCQIVCLKPIAPNLEDVFISLTQKTRSIN
ncbi:ABC transporter ATP-binding protein [Succinispira mobilis]|uniref:ABC transporter ATP-binding protein n=1 Tax=Succinispira mobilis TaxID=78120 RepID=UPI00036831E4|nr:ABC transporter ATP-binding protein [Succinispira mobilis]